MHALKGFFFRVNLLLLQLLRVLYVQTKLINIRFSHIMRRRISMKQVSRRTIHTPFFSWIDQKSSDLSSAFHLPLTSLRMQDLVWYFIGFLLEIVILTTVEELSFGIVFFSVDLYPQIELLSMLQAWLFAFGSYSIHLVVMSFVCSVRARSINKFFL
jgi:hypothetical protein